MSKEPNNPLSKKSWVFSKKAPLIYQLDTLYLNVQVDFSSWENPTFTSVDSFSGLGLVSVGFFSV